MLNLGGDRLRPFIGRTNGIFPRVVPSASRFGDAVIRVWEMCALAILVVD